MRETGLAVLDQLGLDTVGTRGDFQRRYGPSIGTIDRQVAWPLTLDGEPGNEPQMAAVTATERCLRTRMPGRELVVQNVVNWRTIRGYGELWRGSSDWIGRPSR
jgi:hypothetical protein